MTEIHDAVLNQILAKLEQLTTANAILQAKVRGGVRQSVCSRTLMYCLPQQVDALTPSQPYSTSSDGVSTPSSGAGGIPIPHAHPMFPGAFQSAFSQSSVTPTPLTASLNGSSSMVRTASEKEREKERNPYPNRVIISSQLSAITRKQLLTILVRSAYPDQSGIKPTPLQWGASSASSRGPVVCSRLPSSIKLRNAIGAHGGSYSIYKAVAVAIGTCLMFKIVSLARWRKMLFFGRIDLILFVIRRTLSDTQTRLLVDPTSGQHTTQSCLGGPEEDRLF